MISVIARFFGIDIVVVGMVALVVACLGSAVISGVLVHRYDLARHDQVVADLRADAATALATATGKVLAQERAWIAQRDQMETDHVQTITALAADAAAARRAVAAAGGLRDPGARGKGCGCSASVAASPAAGAADAAAGSPLSGEAAEFLLGEADRAETCGAYARLGHAFAVKVKALRDEQAAGGGHD